MTVDAGSIADTPFVVVGAGGLGCPALLGLTAAGVRRVTIVDGDQVEASNLHRQVLYSTGCVGMDKASAAAHAIRRRLPTIECRAIAARLAVEDAPRFMAALPPHAVVLECTDDPGLKFALNDAALASGRPLVVGAALGLRGQVMAVVRGHACYRCIYEDAPQSAATCAGAGVLGPAVGVAGALMAALAIGLARKSETAGRLLAIDLLHANVQTLAPRPRADCRACAGGHPPISSGRPQETTAL